MLSIDKTSRKPIYEQIIESIEREISMGVLRENDKLPSIRELAIYLSINPNTIQKAFVELDRAGLIVSYAGRGCFVASDAREKLRNRRLAELREIEELAVKLYLAGIDEDTVVDAVRRAYKEFVREEERND